MGASNGSAVAAENGTVPVKFRRREKEFGCGPTVTVHAAAGRDVARDQAFARGYARRRAHYQRKKSKARKGAGELESALVPRFGGRAVWERIAAMGAAVHQLV